MKMGSKRAQKQNIFIRIMKGPIWVLTQARDLYVQSLTGAGENISYGNAMGCPTPHIPSLPRSFSDTSSRSGYNTTDAELRELIRAASLNGRIAAEFRRSKSTPVGGGGGAPPPVPRSSTVAFGRIDEEKPFSFEEDDVGLLRGDYTRNRSYAVARGVKVV